MSGYQLTAACTRLEVLKVSADRAFEIHADTANGCHPHAAGCCQHRRQMPAGRVPPCRDTGRIKVVLGGMRAEPSHGCPHVVNLCRPSRNARQAVVNADHGVAARAEVRGARRNRRPTAASPSAAMDPHDNACR